MKLIFSFTTSHISALLQLQNIETDFMNWILLPISVISLEVYVCLCLSIFVGSYSQNLKDTLGRIFFTLVSLASDKIDILQAFG